jgi:hypothetical protein
LFNSQQASSNEDQDMTNTSSEQIVDRLRQFATTNININHEHSTLKEKLLLRAKRDYWKSGDVMSEIGTFSSGIANAAYGVSSNGESRGNVQTTDDGNIAVTVPGVDELVYILKIKEVTSVDSEIEINFYYLAYDMPPPDKEVAIEYCNNKLNKWVSYLKQKKIEEMQLHQSEIDSDKHAEAVKRTEEANRVAEESNRNIQSIRADRNVCIMCGK